MGKREYVPAFFSYKRTLKALSDEQMGRVFRAALEYAENGSEPLLEPIEMMGFAFIREDIDRATAEYEKTCAANKERVGKRWNKDHTETQTEIPDDTGSYRTIPDDTENTIAKAKVNEKAKENVSTDNAPDGATAPKEKRFVRPTVEEVKAYSEEHGLSVNAEHFVDYYNSCGWMVGNKHMKDWKAACRNWSRNNSTYSPRAAPSVKSNNDEIMDYLDRVINGSE